MIITVPTTGTGAQSDGYRPDLPEGISPTKTEYSADYQTVTVTLPDTPEVEQWAVEQGHIRSTPRLAQQAAAKLAALQFIQQDEPDPETATVLAPLFDEFDPTPGTVYTTGDVRQWDGWLIKCIQGYTQQNFPPDQLAAHWVVFRPTAPGQLPPRWLQPGTPDPSGVGLVPPYPLDDMVVHDRPQDDGQDWVFRSKIANNTTEPSRDSTFDRWWEPVSRASEWQP